VLRGFISLSLVVENAVKTPAKAIDQGDQAVFVLVGHLLA
jgi:hypothetical protein